MTTLWDGHDYRGRWIYYLTFFIDTDKGLLGDFRRDEGIPQECPGAFRFHYSHYGQRVKDALRSLASVNRSLRLLHLSMLPDHLHLLLSVEREMEVEVTECVERFILMMEETGGGKSVLRRDYRHLVVRDRSMLERVMEYMGRNPHRLRHLASLPAGGKERGEVVINGERWLTSGNRHLLDNPFKSQVIVHRCDGMEELTRRKREWGYLAENGGVLVSPFVSQQERRVREECERRGGRIIHIVPRMVEEDLSEIGKRMLTEGRLLILAPAEPLEFNRQSCVRMNGLAAAVCGMEML